MAVALPTLGEDLGVDLAGRAWVLAAFSLGFATSTGVFGGIADLVGPRLPLRVGVVLFAVGSVLAGLAPGFGPLIAGRLLQGIGGGAVPVLAVGVVATVFDERHRARALGGLTSVVALVSGCGPLIGGGITTLVGWRGVLALPAVSLLLMEPVARLAPAGRGTGSRRGLDLRGALLMVALVTGVVLVLQSPSTGAGPAVLAAAGALAAGAVALLARHVPRTPEGFLPLALVRDRRFVLTVATGPLMLAPYFGLLLAIPQILRADRGWTPLQIGLALLPAAALGAASSRVAGAVTGRVQPQRLSAAFALGSAAGLIVAALGAPRPAALVLGLALTSCGFAGGQVALLDGLNRTWTSPCAASPSASSTCCSSPAPRSARRPSAAWPAR